MIGWQEPDRRLEASGDSAARAAQDANRAANEVLAERNDQERAAVSQMMKRLESLKQSLLTRLLAGGTDFQMATVRQLARDVDRMITEATAALAVDAEKAYQDQAELGDGAGIAAMRAAKMVVAKTTPGIDQHLVTSAFDNTVDLLTLPMQQFGADVKVALRKVALAGDGTMGQIINLREKIAGQGFDSAQYRAERIIRTELGRVFNDANYARLMALAKDFGFLRKGWRAAGDNRTRLGHREAGKTYGRGAGIPIHAGFVLNVYNEQKGKAARLIGQASLRFPLDPQASPAGRIAAGATIMCRCNAFVDFDLRDLRLYQRDQLRIALPRAVEPPAAPAPLPAPTPVPKVPKVKTTTKPKVTTPKVATPTGKDVLPQLGGGAGADVPGAMGPGGKPITSALAFGRSMRIGPRTMSAAWNAKTDQFVRDAYAVLDSVHGDGDLGQLPIIGSASRGAFGAYWRGGMGGRPMAIGFKQSTANFNTIFHETGHWLDHVAIKGPFRSGFASEDKQNLDMEGLRQALHGSQAIQTMKRWVKASRYSPADIDTYGMVKQNIDLSNGHWGDGIMPDRVQPDHLRYLLTNREIFARAYAQYVAKKAGGAAAEELQTLQRHVEFTTSGESLKGVKQVTSAKTSPADLKAAKAARKAGDPAPKQWAYLDVWQDADFAPIEKAFDELFEKMGWRIPKKGGG